MKTQLQKSSTAYLNFKTVATLLLIFFGILSSEAQSNRTPTFTGAIGDFNATERLAAAANSTTYAITFDQTNIYIGAFRTTGSFGANDNFAIYIDTDPNSTPASGTGTTTGYSYSGVTGSLPFSANYTAHVEQSYQEIRQFSGGSWGSSSSPTVFTNTTAREITIPWSSIGSPKAINLTMWMGYTGGFFSNAPGTNIAASANPSIVSYFGTFGVVNGTQGGVNPVSVVSLPATDYLNATSGTIAAGTYANIDVAGATGLAGNVTLSPGAVVTIVSGNSFTVAGGNRIINTAVTNNLTSTRLQVDGTMTINGTVTNQVNPNTITVSNGASLTNSTTAIIATAMAMNCTRFNVNSGGSYFHDAVGTTAAGISADFPGTTRTFGATSNVTISKWGNGLTAPGGSFPNAMGNVTINIATLAGSWNQTGSVTSIQGNLNVQSTGGGARELRFTGATGMTLNIGGSVNLSGGLLTWTSGASTANVNITGDYNQTNATTLSISGGGTCNMNVSGNFSVATSGLIIRSSGTATIVFNKASGSQTFSNLGSLTTNPVAVTVGTGSSTNTLTLSTPMTLSTLGILTVATGATLSAGTNSITCAANNINGNLTTLGNINGNSTLSVNNGGVLTIGDCSTSPTCSVSGGGTNVASGGTLIFNNESILAGTTAFTLSSGGNLRIGSANGITTSGTSGNVQSTGVRSFNTGGNYSYVGCANQDTGNGLPATVNTLTINNTGTNPTNIVTLTAIASITSTTNSLLLQAGRFNLNNKQLLIPNNGTVASTGGDFTSTDGPIYFFGAGTVSGTVNFPTVRLSGGVNFGSSSNVVTSMLMESGSFVNTNAPTYGSGSTLIYNTTGTYGRNLEWSATSGKGYPNHVQIQNGTTVDLSANGFADRAIAGNLNLGLDGAASAGSLSMGATTNKLTVGGNVVIGGNTSGTSTLTLSSAVGGDIYLTGNWDTKTNGVSVSSTRAVFFEGAGISTVTTIGSASFDYLFINKTSGGTVSLANDMTVNNNLTLNAQLVTNAFKVIIPVSSGVTANPNGWVRGNLQKNIPTGTNSRTFEIGDTTKYTPVTTAYVGVTGAGDVTLSTTSNDHPQIATSGIDAARSVNRFYTIANSGVAGGTYDATFTFVAGDIDGGALTSTFGASSYVNPNWTSATIGTRTSTTTQATGLSTYGDFQLGEPATTWTAGASTTAWATSGNWSHGVPTAGSNVVIASASVYPEITTTVTANSLNVAISTSLTVKQGANLTLTDKMANAGTITIENNANLKQINDITNTGSGSTIVKRNTAALMRQDYVMWSSPVSGQQLQAFSSQTLSTRFYTFDGSLGSAGQYVATSATGSFNTGIGYLIRLPNTHPVTPTSWSGTFTGGNAINGTQGQSSLTAGRYYAVGNPYSSTIDADAFINDNNLTEAIYFWRKTNNAATSSYATYTLAGGVSNSGGDPLALQPNGFIQVGQGFIARVPTGESTLEFTNTMRVINNGNQFFRRLEDRSRFWLNLTNDQGYFGQMMVAYMPNATNGYDPAIDGLYFNDSETALTSTIAGQDYIIQGRALPFEATDVVALGFKSELAGNFNIAINNFDGTIFDTNNQAIYLKDNLTNTVHDLRAGSYNFATEAGVFNNRFEVQYDNFLSVGNTSLTANTVAVYKQNHEIVVNAGNIKLSKVQIYDIRGRLLVEKSNIDGSEVRLNAGTTNQVVLVKVTSANNEVVTKKIVN